MVATKLSAYARLALVGISMVGCGVDLRFAEDGGGGAASTGGAGSAAGGAGSGGGEAAYDLQAECAALCDQPCVGAPSICTEYCVEAGERALGCGRESVEWYACTMDYCVGEQDCSEIELDIFDCLGRGGCKDPRNDSYEVLCETSSGSVCDESGCHEVDACGCSAPCYDGHEASVSCDVDWEDYDDEMWFSPRFDCRCFFDGELIGECSIYNSEACQVEDSCCRGLFAVD